MSTFTTTYTTIPLPLIKAREIVEQLFINDIGQLDLLEQSLAGTTYRGEFIGLIAFIQHIANGGEPGNKKAADSSDNIAVFRAIKKKFIESQKSKKWKGKNY